MYDVYILKEEKTEKYSLQQAHFDCSWQMFARPPRKPSSRKTTGCACISSSQLKPQTIIVGLPQQQSMNWNGDSNSVQMASFSVCRPCTVLWNDTCLLFKNFSYQVLTVSQLWRDSQARDEYTTQWDKRFTGSKFWLTYTWQYMIASHEEATIMQVWNSSECVRSQQGK